MTVRIIGVIDHGIGNIGSLGHALSRLGNDWRPVCRPTDFKTIHSVVLPGVGTFPAVMQALAAADLVEALGEWVYGGRPLLGICVGMQVLASKGCEIAETAGLNLIEGQVLPMDSTHFRLPQLGFNTVEWNPHGTNGMANPQDRESDYYFLNSYHFVPRETDFIEAWYWYGERYVAAVRKDSVTGVQFHPEKSQKLGLRTLGNLIDHSLTI